MNKKRQIFNKLRNFTLSSILKKIRANFFITAYADNTMATAIGTGAGTAATMQPLPNALRVVYSKDIEYKALPQMKFRQFATLKTDLTVTPGRTIEMLTYDNLKRGGKLTEGIHMQTQGMNDSAKDITVYEYGNAVAQSFLLMQTSWDNTMNEATTLLSRDYAITLDCELRDAALSGTNVIYARNTSTGNTTASRSAITAQCGMNVATIKDAVEVLSTNNAPKYQGLYWICFVHPHQSRVLRDDPAWIEASKYGKPDQLFTGEIGMIDDVKFIETTIMSNGGVGEDDPGYNADLKAGAGSPVNQVNIYQAILFGDVFFGLATAYPVEMRHSGIVDFGREIGLAWYGIFGTGILHDDYGIRIETA
jgi:N4-gp56 family major capsid protein